jgi:hypothetical protein
MYRIYQRHLLLNDDIHLEPEIEPQLSEFRKSKSWFYRRIKKWDTSESSFYYVIQDQVMTMESMKSKIRTKLRKSLSNVEFSPSNLEDILFEGFHLYEQMPTFGDSSATPEKFRDYLTSRVGRIDYHVGRRSLDRKIVCFAGVVVSKESVDLSFFRYDREERISPVYGMLYYLNNYYIAERGFKYINDGFKSYLHGANFQKKLIKEFNYRKCFVEIEIYSKYPLGLIRLLIKIFRSNEKLKALGFYLEDYANEQRKSTC